MIWFWDSRGMQEASLQSSRWAPSGPRKTGGFQTTIITSAQVGANTLPTRRLSSEKRKDSQILAFQKFLKCVRRLKWKSTTLLFCHHRALNQQTDNLINKTNFPISTNNGKANAAEINFKLDFFEYYGLLERTIVNLLECFSIVISANCTSDNVPLPPANNSIQVRRVENSM